MKIKRFFAKEMRQGIRQVRETLGADAVILSNTQVKGGIEIVAAIDYDESLLSGDSASTDASVDRVAGAASPKPPRKVMAKEPSIVADAVISQRHKLPELNFSGQGQRTQPDGEIPRPAIKPAAAKRTVAAPKANTAERRAESPRVEQVEWSQDPAIVDLKNEIHEMRDLLEQQLSSLAWGELGRSNPQRAKLTRCLLELGLSPTICERIVEASGKHDSFDSAWRQVLAILAHSVPINDTDILDQGGVVALIGATGVGKTTTIAKLAARYALRHGSDRVAMVTTDGYRIAAHEQLRTYGRILDIPVRIANNHEELSEALKILSDRDLVLIDTAGMSQRDIRLTEQFQLIQKSAPCIKTYLVLSTTTHRAGLREIVNAFGEVKLDGCILTKLDETTSLGGALSTVMENDLPIAYVSDGQRVPEDIHIARGHSLINKAVLIAQETNLALDKESLNLAFSGMVANAHG
jgi:flagellar biosynthesis protein FlhF